jgi:glycosyltransferase involved in cell wall biosynthesis
MAATAPLVSVLLTAYNHAAFIDAAIQSVFEQTYSNFEIIAADDGSVDGTPDRIRQWAERDTRVVPLLSSCNRGLSANWNAGLDRCRGEFIAGLSADDIMLPDRLAAQVAYLQRHPDCGICTHDMDVFDARSGKTLCRLNERFARKDGGAEVLFTVNWLFGREIKSIPSSHMYRASAVGGQRYDPRLQIMNEWLFEIDCLVMSGMRWGSLPDVLGRYRVHDQQTSTSADAMQRGLEETMMVLAIAAVRYPHLAALIKTKREFVFFKHLVFDWLEPDKRPAVDRQFRNEAGLAKWFYMRAARRFVQHEWLIDASRPARRLVQRLFRHA